MEELKTIRLQMKNSMTDITYLLVFVLVYLFSLLPFSVLYGVATLLYFLVYKVFKYRYSVVLQNLSRSLPGKSYGEIRHVAGGFYKFFTHFFAEVVKLTSISERQLAQRFRLVNPEMLEQYHREGRNIIAVLGHYGNWEYTSIIPRQVSFPVHAIYKPLSNKVMDRLIKRARTRFGMHLLSMQETGRYMLQHKNQSHLYLFVADQSPSPEAKCDVEFMHQRTYMFSGAEKLAKATNAVVVYLDIRHAGNGCWEAHSTLVTDAPGETAPHEITRAFASLLEESIQEAPQYWLWSHRRWKHKH